MNQTFKIPDEIKNMDKFMNMKPGIYKNVAMIKEMKQNPKYSNYLKNYKPSNKINKWFDEIWISIEPLIKEGKIVRCGRSDASKGKYPVCRPLIKVDETTPITIWELLAQPKAIPKLKKAIKQKQENPKTRIDFKKMISPD